MSTDRDQDECACFMCHEHAHFIKQPGRTLGQPRTMAEVGHFTSTGVREGELPSVIDALPSHPSSDGWFWFRQLAASQVHRLSLVLRRPFHVPYLGLKHQGRLGPFSPMIEFILAHYGEIPYAAYAEMLPYTTGLDLHYERAINEGLANTRRLAVASGRHEAHGELSKVLLQLPMPMDKSIPQDALCSAAEFLFNGLQDSLYAWVVADLVTEQQLDRHMWMFRLLGEAVDSLGEDG